MVKYPKRRLFVEGGGNNNDALRTECRQGFATLLRKAGFEGRMPKIIACGGRQNAYEQFCTAFSDGSDADVAMLLVDAEEQVTVKSPWAHVKARQGDGWEKPTAATDDHLHLMVVCMESWFLADKDTLALFFGQNFRLESLPANPNVEQVSKADVYKGLENATKDTKKGVYGKSVHSFKILAFIDPTKVRSVAPSANRLLEHLGDVL